MSVLNHWLAGYGYGLGLRFVSRVKAEAAIVRLDLWGWAREVTQHDSDLSPHQRAEARAWGEGARFARGLNPPLPKPPYPV